MGSFRLGIITIWPDFSQLKLVIGTTNVFSSGWARVAGGGEPGQAYPANLGVPRKKWASAQEQQQLLSQTRAVVVTSTALKLLSDVVGERRSIVALSDCQRLSLEVVRCFFCPSE